ncbi:MAG: glutamate synthase large subunit, partial [Gammaproteobacteria bacterium]|nr:glutamate synthase large subunit [Gammaproteobacteria bacterium]
MSKTGIPSSGLYRPQFEKDSCGFGLIAQMDAKPSHWLVNTAIGALARLTHRGAVAADGKSGDGCGLLMKKPQKFLESIAKDAGFSLNKTFAVGMVFLNQDTKLSNTAKQCLESHLKEQNLDCVGWRKVPVNPDACGEESLKSLPEIEQVFVNAPEGMDDAEFERKLYVARRKTEIVIEPKDKTFYMPSLSANVLSYKGLVMPENLPVFYKDLQNENLESDLCVFHQRFSTNTWPQWRLAQPFRHLAHNGEINTIQGNRNWSVARGHKFETPLLKMEDVRPLVSMSGSDSNSLDNMLEALLAGGMDIFRAMRLLVPPAWQNVETMDSDLRAFYEYNSMHMESWDGPAGIVLTDGRYAACSMDRNGLRPARWVMTKDRHITLASEIGVYDYAPEDVEMKGRLKPGQMIAADTRTGKLLFPEDIDNMLKQRHPYKQWLNENTQRLEAVLFDSSSCVEPFDPDRLNVYQKLFQVSYEERDQVLRVIAEAGQEAVGSMGDDTPLPVLSKRVRSIYDYFRQQFAQVTNPPIDPIREQIVMSMETCFGREHNLFEETPEHAHRLLIRSPILSKGKFQQLMSMDDPGYAHHYIDLNYDAKLDLRSAIESVCQQAAQAVKSGKVILVLSDKNIDQNKKMVPALLATGAVHHHLIKAGLRCDSNIVVETGSARDPHHFAVLIGYGATAVFPYLAYECLNDMARKGEVKDPGAPVLAQKYRQGINKGLHKIISKMGISTIASYRGAQLFESVGLHDDVVNLCFCGTTNRLQGTHFEDIEHDQSILTELAWNPRKTIDQGGLLKFVHGGEEHAYNPDVVKTLQAAVATGDMKDFKVFSNLVNNRSTISLRDMFKLRDGVKPVSIDEVEPVEDILKRFDSAAMSLGALSPEAHETLAQAMNRLGARSNSGEGGEDPVR